MAKELKVFISADASQAIKGMDGFTDSLSKMQKDVAKASNNVDAAQQNLINNLTDQSAAKEYAATIQVLDANTEKLLQRMQKEIGIMNQNGATVKQLRTEYNKLGKVMGNLQLGQGNIDTKAINTLKSWQDEIQNEIKSMASPNINTSDNLISFYEAIGDEVGIAREKLSLYERQLRTAIATEGKSSVSARKLTKTYKEQAEQLEKLEKQSKKTDGRIKNLITSFVSAQAIVYLVQKGFNLITTALTDWAAAAAKAEETANLFNTTFGDIAASANQVATTMKTQLGMANSTMQETLGLFGDLAIGYGQTQTAALEFARAAAQTSLDIISFKNISGDTTEIMQTFASGLAGNFENFRKYGIIVTQAEIKTRLQQKSLDKLSGSALQFAKIQETLNIVQEKAVNAQGDMIKTLDSTENLNRRVNEANKQLMENLGKGINTVLNPLKRAWLDIADAINRATDAQTLFDAGQKNINVYDIRGSEEDRNSFQGAIQLVTSNFDLWNSTGGMDSTALQSVYDDFYEIFIKFNSSFADLPAYVSNYSNAIVDVIKRASTQAEKDRELEAQTMELNTQFREMQGNVVNFINALSDISGVLFDHDYAASAGRVTNTYGNDTAGTILSKYITNSIEDAILSLDTASWQDYFSQIELMFSATETEGLERKLTEIESLYEILYNYVATGQIKLENSEEYLSQIVSLWNEVNADLQTIQEDAERLKNYENALNSANTDLSSTNDSIAKLGMSDAEAAAYDINKQRNEALSYASTQEEINELNRIFDSLIESSNALYAAQDKLAKQEEYNSLLESAGSSLTDARNTNIRYGMNERQAAAFDISLERSAAISSAIDNGASDAEIAKLVDLFDKWLDENDKYYDKLASTEIADFFDSFNTTDTTYSYAGFGGNTVAQDAYNQAMQEGVAQFTELKKTLEDLGYSSEELSDVQTQAYEEIRNAAIDAGNAASAQASQDMWSGVFGNGMSALGEVGSLISSITDAASLAGGPMAILVDQLISLASQTQLMTEITTLLSDAFVPVLDAFLKPLVPFIQSLGMVLQELLYSALNPFYELMLSLGEILTMTVELLNPILEMIRTVSDYIGDYLYPIFAALSDLFSVLIEPLSVILNLLGGILLPILNLLTPVLDALAYAFTFVYAVINVVVNFVVDVFKWLVGTVVSFFTGIYNWIVKTLRGINIFGWRPFGGLKTIDDSKYQEWADINPFDNAQDNWDKAFELLDKNNKISMEIADNTSQDTDISQLEKVYEAGLISASEFEALVAEETGQKYNYKDDILSSSAQYVQNQTSTTISYGSVTININGYDGDAKSLAREVKGILERDAKNPTFDMVG